MSISVIRKVTSDDLAAVNAAAVRFCDRHGIQYDDPDEAEREVEMAVLSADEDAGRQSRLGRNWQRCFCRALGEPYDSQLMIAWGYVGVSLE